VTELIAAHLSCIAGQPVFQPVPAELAGALQDAPPPESGRTADEVLAILSAGLSGAGRALACGLRQADRSLAGVHEEGHRLLEVELHLRR
jgi:hypothetical protein